MQRVVIQAQLLRLEQSQLKVELTKCAVDCTSLDLIGEYFEKAPGSRDA